MLNEEYNKPALLLGGIPYSGIRWTCDEDRDVSGFGLLLLLIAVQQQCIPTNIGWQLPRMLSWDS